MSRTGQTDPEAVGYRPGSRAAHIPAPSDAKPDATPDPPPRVPRGTALRRPAAARRPLRRVAVVLATTIAFLPLIGLGAFALRVASPPPATGPAPGIAVLTGGPDRVERGLALLASRDDARLLISGVGHSVVPADLGAEGARITLGRTATSTRGNAREVAAWARANGLTEITIVTAGYHMPRALLELRRALPTATFTAHPVPPHLPRSAALLREYAKLVGAALGLSALVDRPRPPEESRR